MSESSRNWEWDETLYAGAARYYAAGRMPHPVAIAESLRAELCLGSVGGTIAHRRAIASELLMSWAYRRH